MATEDVSTVIPSGGGDYTTLNAWESGEQKNLVSADQIAVAECSDGNLTSVDLFDIAGWTVDSTRYIVVRAASGSEQDGAPADTSVPYVERTPGATNAIFRVFQDFFRLKGLQITCLGASGRCIHIESSNTSGHFRIEECLIISEGTEAAQFPFAILFTTGGTGCGGGGADGANRVYNNTVLVKTPPGTSEGGPTGFIQFGADTVCSYYNNTILCTESPGGGAMINVQNGGTGTSQNNYIHVTGSCLAYFNATKGNRDATSNSEASTSNYRNIAYDNTNFTNATSVRTTFNVKTPTGSFLINRGADLSGSEVLNENDGTVRIGQDVGAHDFGVPICWNYTAKYKGSNRLYKVSGPGSFPKRLNVPVNVDKSTGQMIDDGVLIDPDEYEVT